jgi:hypothetical protein
MTANPRRSRATSRPGSKVPARECTTLVEYSVPEAFRPPTISKKNTTAETAAKALVYLNDMKRPNVHTTLHYKALLDEYAMPSNLNVLIGEDKRPLGQMLRRAEGIWRLRRKPRL